MKKEGFVPARIAELSSHQEVVNFEYELGLPASRIRRTVAWRLADRALGLSEGQTEF